MAGPQTTQPALGPDDAQAMSSISDLTLEILKGIRSDLKNLQDEVRNGFASVNQRFDDVSRRIDGTNERIDGNNERLDSVIKIVGSHHDALADRVSRIEDHLGLPREL
jgi:hypothetical protein